MNPHTLSSQPSKLSVRTMVAIALITAITCCIAPFSIPIPMSPVPITLTNLVLFISIYVIGWKRALVSLILYLLLGMVGLPVFSGFSGGLAKFAGPTGGYLIGFLFMVLIAGLFIDKFQNHRFLHIVGMVLATIVAYTFGTLWLAFQMELSFMAALAIGVLPYLIGDGLKIIIASLVGPMLKSRLSQVNQP